jgi:hypothetical protein
MKTSILLVIVLFIVVFSSKGQTTFNINNVNGQTITSCNTILYDSGGPTGTYQNNEDYWVTFCSGTTDCFQIQFTGTFNLETSFEHLYIYDGNNTSANILANLTGSTLPANVLTSGNCVTIRFISDGSATYEGFQMNISCTGTCYVPPPPPINDDPCTAFPIPVNATCNFTQYTCQSATGTTNVPAPSCAYSYSGGDVWFSAVVPASGLLAIQLGAQVMTIAGIAIYSGTDCNTLTEIICNENNWSIPPTQYLTSTLGLAGQTVWIRIWEPENNNPGTFNICAFEPAPFLEVDTTIYTPQQLVQNILLSGYLTASNITYTGSPNAIGFFHNGNSIGFSRGIALSTGKATDIMGYGDATMSSTDLGYNGDSTLNLIVGPDLTHDASVLEFDFIPLSDTLNFRFVFGSDEYPEFTFSFNDVFGFFLSGPNPSGGNYTNQNIALIPGTSLPVSIYNVNNGANTPTNGPCVNCQYYIDNTSGIYSTSFDGFTTPLTATAAVTPCQPYHIKLSIADANDGILDSGVLLEAVSFSSGGGDIKINDSGPFCSTDTLVNLSANVSCGTWAGQGITNSNTGNFNPSLAGIGVHKIYYSLPYETDSTLIYVTSCTSVSDINSNLDEVSIFPNPNKNFLFVHIPFEEKFTITIFDINGKIIFSSVSENNLLTINTSKFESGYYLISILTENKNEFHSKLIVE